MKIANLFTLIATLQAVAAYPVLDPAAGSQLETRQTSAAVQPRANNEVHARHGDVKGGESPEEPSGPGFGVAPDRGRVRSRANNEVHARHGDIKGGESPEEPSGLAFGVAPGRGAV